MHVVAFLLCIRHHPGHLLLPAARSYLNDNLLAGGLPPSWSALRKLQDMWVAGAAGVCSCVALNHDVQLV